MQLLIDDTPPASIKQPELFSQVSVNADHNTNRAIKFVLAASAARRF